MKRKKWTPRTEINETVLLFREKRKWQIALRRYLLMQNKSSYYAPYFGLDIKNFRKWMEIQFVEGMNWDNFSAIWQLDHIIPIVYFDFGMEKDLRLCWNFTNIRAEKRVAIKDELGRTGRLDLIGAKSYFKYLFSQTNYPVCLEMLDKIENIESVQLKNSEILGRFIQDNKQLLETISSFSQYEYLSLNQGNSVDQILLDREFLKKIEGS